MTRRLRDFKSLLGVRDQLEAERLVAERQAAQLEAQRREQAALKHEFQAAMTGVTPIKPHGRKEHSPMRPPAYPFQKQQDEQAALLESLSDGIDSDALLETDENLSFRRDGIGPDVLRKLRRGQWVVQAELDLHGLRTDEARQALVDFLRQCALRQRRCVRIVHGKGLGSINGEPVLRGKVRRWLAQREEVLAYCHAQGRDGGTGALLVLLSLQNPVNRSSLASN